MGESFLLDLALSLLIGAADVADHVESASQHDRVVGHEILIGVILQSVHLDELLKAPSRVLLFVEAADLEAVPACGKFISWERDARFKRDKYTYVRLTIHVWLSATNCSGKITRINLQ